MARRNPILTFLPILFAVMAFVAILLMLLAGVNNSLAEIYYFKTNLQNLNLPAPLSSSVFLTDISTESGDDLVGGAITASRLNLADAYTVNLLTYCARFASGTSCTKPYINFRFNPGVDMKFDATDLFNRYTNDYRWALSAYNRTAPFIAGAFVLCALTTGLTAILAAVGACASFGTGLAAFFAAIATIFLLSANAAATYVFTRLNRDFNAAFNERGVSSSLGVIPLALGWVSFVLMLFAVGMLVAVSRTHNGGPRSGFYGKRSGPKGGALITGQDISGRGTVVTGLATEQDTAYKPKGAAEPSPGLLGRIPTWSRHKYVQVQKQPALGASEYPGQEQTGLISGAAEPGTGVPAVARGGVLDEDWAADDEYSRARYGDGGAARQEAVPMRDLSAGRTSIGDAGNAYEPYKASQAS